MRKIVCSVIIFILLASCSNKNYRQITVSIGCEDIETLSDLEYHVLKLDSFFKENNISLKWDTLTTNCGFELKNNDSSIFIDHVMTDVDMLELCLEFFNRSKTK
jgi:hypothetical protein